MGLDRRFNLFLQPSQNLLQLGAVGRILLARVDLLSEVTDLLQRQRNFAQSRCDPGGQPKLPHERILRRFHTRIQLDRQRLRAALAVC